MSRLPFRVTLLLWLVLILTVWNVIRLWTSLSWREVLVEYAARPDPVLAGLVAAIWVMIGSLIIWGIWQNKPWTVKLLLGAAVTYSAWYWIERLIWQSARPNWPFAVILNLMVLIFTIFAAKPLSREAYDRKSPNQKAE